MPSPMAVAATLRSRGVAYTHAEVVGDEVKKKGNDVVYAPAVNMLRTPLNGRTFEYFGEDPFLAGQIAVGWTKGVQSAGVIANVKHFAVNNQEGQALRAARASPLGAGGRRQPPDSSTRSSTSARCARSTSRSSRRRQGGRGRVDHVRLPARQRPVRVRERSTCSTTSSRATGASRASCSPTTARPRTRSTRSTTASTSTSGRPSPTSRRSSAPRSPRRRSARRPSTSTSAGSCARCSPSASSTATPTPTTTAAIDQDAHNEVAAEIESAGHRPAAQRRRRCCRSTPAKVGKVALIGPEADEIKDGGGSSAIDEFRITTPKAAFETTPRRRRASSPTTAATPRAAAAAAKAADVGGRRGRRQDDRGLRQAVHGAQLRRRTTASTATR